MLGGWTELPEVVETAGRVIDFVAAPKEPEMAAAVDPGGSGVAASGHVSSRRRSQRAVHANLVTRAGSAHPCPLAGGRIELPKIVEFSARSRGAGAGAPKEPEMAAAVGPTRGLLAASWDVAGRRRAQRAVDARLAHGVASTHPCPLIRGWIEVPQVVEVAITVVAVQAQSAKVQKLAVAAGPGRCAIAAAGNIGGGGSS